MISYIQDMYSTEILDLLFWRNFQEQLKNVSEIKDKEGVFIVEPDILFNANSRNKNFCNRFSVR